MAERRLFLKSLIGASVAYCFLQSLPIIGHEASEIGLWKMGEPATLRLGDNLTITGVYDFDRFLQNWIVTEVTPEGHYRLKPKALNFVPEVLATTR